jgi:uncharacterized protein
MKKFITFLISIVFLMSSTTSYADSFHSYKKDTLEMLSKYKVSFDCSKASTDLEKKICSNNILSQLDGLLANTYKSRQSPKYGLDLKNFRQAQLNWIKDRNKCKDAKCTLEKYQDRIFEICDLPAITGAKFQEDCDVLMDD